MKRPAASSIRADGDREPFCRLDDNRMLPRPVLPGPSFSRCIHMPWRWRGCSIMVSFTNVMRTRSPYRNESALGHQSICSHRMTTCTVPYGRVRCSSISRSDSRWSGYGSSFSDPYRAARVVQTVPVLFLVHAADSMNTRPPLDCRFHGGQDHV